VASLTLLDSVAPWVVQAEPPQDEAVVLAEVYAAIAAMAGVKTALDPVRLRQSNEVENDRYLAGLLNENGNDFHENQIAAFREVYRTSLRCYRAYNPPTLPRDIDVSLYRATQGNARTAAVPGDYGWNRLLQGPIRVHDVDADHASILNKVQFQEAGSQIVQFVG
jgi:thioesterase domain-containing protein